MESRWKGEEKEEEKEEEEEKEDVWYLGPLSIANYPTIPVRLVGEARVCICIYIYIYPSPPLDRLRRTSSYRLRRKNTRRGRAFSRGSFIRRATSKPRDGSGKRFGGQVERKRVFERGPTSSFFFPPFFSFFFPLALFFDSD